jgi:RNA polymerase sigma-70 factor, ECF subfamily
MAQSLTHGSAYPLMDAASRASRGAAAQRAAQELVTNHVDFISRLLRHLGVGDSELEDAVQSVFVTATLKLDHIVPGKERGFLVAIAQRVAFRNRRNFGRRKEVLDEDLLERSDPAAGPDELADERRALQDLDRILDAMPLELRSVFVLRELEELEGVEIAELLGIPLGTVASRLRRAREDFRERVRRFQRKTQRSGSNER